jgi:hypothetical protein
VVLFCIFYGVFQACLFKAFKSKLAGIASAAGQSFFVRVIAAMGDGIINAEPSAGFYYLSFGHFDYRCVDFIFAFFLNRSGCGKISHFFKGLDILWPAVWIAAVIGGVDTYENIKRSDGLGDCQCET